MYTVRLGQLPSPCAMQELKINAGALVPEGSWVEDHLHKSDMGTEPAQPEPGVCMNSKAVW